MINPQQYLRFNLGGVPYLLSGRASVAIDQRHNLEVNDTGDGNVSAWRAHDTGRWPAFCLDREVRVSHRDDWEHAIFLDARPYPVGLIADQVELMAQGEVHVVPFTPLGPPPTRVGHLFTGAWVRGARAVLVFDPDALVAYLQGLETT